MDLFYAIWTSWYVIVVRYVKFPLCTKRHYLPLKHLKQIYYNFIYPYISFAIVAGGSTSKTNLQKIQTKQNHVIWLMFFATLSGKSIHGALPLLNIEYLGNATGN